MNVKDALLIADIAVAIQKSGSVDLLPKLRELVERSDRVNESMKREMSSLSNQLKNEKETISKITAERDRAVENYNAYFEADVFRITYLEEELTKMQAAYVKLQADHEAVCTILKVKEST